MAGHLHEITDDDFEQEVLKATTPVLVDFWATWCGPCRSLAPTVEKLSRDYAGKIKFCKVDVDHNPDNAAQYGVRSIPTLILFNGGQAIGQLVGNVPRHNIEELFSKAG